MRLARLALAGLLSLTACEVATTPSPRSSNEALWNEAKARPQLLSGALFTGAGDAETVARAFLASRAGELHLDGVGLTLGATRIGLAGTYLRFAQTQAVGAEVLPVFEAEVIVLVRDAGERREVRAVNLEHREEATGLKVAGDLGEAFALGRALELLQVAPPYELEPTAARGVFVTTGGEPRLAWRVKVGTEAPPHDWTVYLDAATGEELGRRDGVRFLDGTGYVYDVNPVASTGDLSLVDGNDATTPALEAARFLVTLPRLDGSGFTRGDWADTRTRDAGARAYSMSNEFLFTRDNFGFEQANAYFHLDRAQARIQALGFTNVNNRVQGATVDAQSADNSFYTSSSGRLSFGRGGVDDAEDGDIVVHEYGHSIQDNQVPGFGGGDEGAMGEGFGDYLAASFKQTLPADAGRPQLGDPACVGDWDGTAYSTATPKCLRRVDSKKHYPEAERNQVHADGELWSSALWDLRGQLGADTTDRLVLEGHFLLGTSSSFFTASQALLTADVNVNGGVNGVAIRRTMIRHGLSRLLTPQPAMGPTTRFPVRIGPTRDSAGNYANNTDETRTFSVPGASGLLVHFARLDLELNNQCLQRSCDNVYLTNAEGDLFEVLLGARSNFTALAVAGDTVNVRLVSDNSQVRFGYQIDWVDAIDAPVDAGLLYDGGMDTFDAGLPVVDAGRPDAGPPDAGTPDAGVADAGVVDAGPPMVDAGVMGPTTRVLSAAGVEELKPALTRGCGCGAASGIEAWLALAALGLLRRRRG